MNLLSFVFCACVVTPLRVGGRESPKPNIVFFIVDDLGWGNVGYHRDEETAIPEIQTPNLDKYAKLEGLELNRHYVHPTCTPTRSSFFSGRLPIHVQTSLKGPEEPDSGIPRHMKTFPKLLQQEGYRTHIVGKWDAGFASFDHTPKGRGFDSSLIYMEHGSEYFTHKIDALVAKCAYYRGYEDLNDLWEHDDLNGVKEGPASFKKYDKYVEYHFRDRAVEIIENHAEHHKDDPLFLVYASHLHHQPLQVPQDEMIPGDEIFPSDPWLCSYSTQYVHDNLRNPRDFGCRRIYTSMIRMMDRMFGELMETLKSNGMWKDTLVVFTSDNGGSTWLMEGAASNFPLRGGKYSEFEGGTRAVAFVTGGYLPRERIGQREDRMIHVADWYATFTSMAGLERGQIRDVIGVEKYKYPEIDSLDVSSIIFESGIEEVREGYHLNEKALVKGSYKYLVGLMESANLPTKLYPTNYSVFGKNSVDDGKMDCSRGCLFDVVKDPDESRDLSENPLYGEIFDGMRNELEDLNQYVWVNQDDGGDNSCPVDCESGANCLNVCPNNHQATGGAQDLLCVPCGCWMSRYYWKGNVGPFQIGSQVACPDKETMQNCPIQPVVLPSHVEL